MFVEGGLFHSGNNLLVFVGHSRLVEDCNRRQIGPRVTTQIGVSIPADAQ